MALLEDILLRFRRVWAPAGAVAGQTSMPADLQAQVEDELRELTVALSAIDEEGRSVVRAAEAEAARILGEAQLEADRLLEAARAGIPEARARSAAAFISDRRIERDALIARAEKEARLLHERARKRMPGVVGRAAGDVFARLDVSAKEKHARVMGGG